MKRFLNVLLVFTFLGSVLSLSYAMKRSLGPTILKKKKIDIEGTPESLEKVLAALRTLLGDLQKEDPSCQMIIENSSEQNDSSIEKSDSDCEEHKESTEEIAFEKLSCWKAFDDLSNEIGMLSKDDVIKLLNCFPKLQELYQQYNTLNDYMQANTSFFFCCGLFAYYLEKEKSVDELKEWFESNLNMKLTKENGIELIKKSPGEHAYFFLQSLGL